MQPNPRAEPGFVVAFGKIVKRIAEALTETPESELPIKMFVFGGAAVHLYPKFALEIFWVNFRQNLPAPKKISNANFGLYACMGAICPRPDAAGRRIIGTSNKVRWPAEKPHMY